MGVARAPPLPHDLFNCELSCELVPTRVPIRSQYSQSVSHFTVPPRAHPSTGSQSGSATPGLTQVEVPSTRSRGLLNCRK